MQRDKLMHFAVGFLIAIAAGSVHPVLGQAAAVAAGKLKEDYDRAHPENHTEDGWDAYATAAGAVPAAILQALFPWVLVRYWL